MGDMLQETGPARAWRPFTNLVAMAGVGAAAGLALRILTDTPDAGSEHPARIAACIGVFTFAAALILLQELRRPIASAIFGVACAIVFALLTYWRLHAGGDDNFMSPFWLALGWPLCGFIAFTLTAAAIEQRALRFPYPVVFKHALAGPVGAALGVLSAGAMALFLILWSQAFGMLNVEPLKEALESPWLLMPMAGAAGGVGATFALQDARLLGVGEAILLIGARILLPMVALFSALFAVLLPMTGIEGLRAGVSPTGLLLSITLGAVLVFNGVYRDGGRAPGPWLRWPAWFVVAVLPVLTLTALYGVAARIGPNGLTPPRIVAGVTALIASAYALALLTALASELPRWRRTAQGWMPPVARLNIAFALVWAGVLILMQTPLLDPLALSAANQSHRLEKGVVSAEDFDFAYLQFQLGRPGRTALERMEQWADHPEADQIASKIADTRAADNYWAARNEEPAPEPALPETATAALAEFDRRVEADADAIDERTRLSREALMALACDLEATQMDAEARRYLENEIERRYSALGAASNSLRILRNETIAFGTDWLEDPCGARQLPATSN
jgi:hypothetical protein